MKRIPLFIFLNFFGLSFIFNSCTKSQSSATEYDSTKLTTPSPVTIGLKHALPDKLKESSGLAFTNGNLWSFGDSGNPNEIYKIDSTTGAILQTVVITNFQNTDWEDITSDSLYIYIGDFGNNDGNRKDLKIIRILKSDISETGAVIKVQGESINFNYADQTDYSFSSNNNFDCESVISVDTALYLFTKDGIDLQTRCYKLPNQPGDYSVSPVSSFDTKGKITGTAYNPVTKEIALLGYMNKKVESFVWFLNDYSKDNFFSGTTTKITIGSGKDWQTEGIDYISSKRLFITCESSTSQIASLYFLQKN